MQEKIFARGKYQHARKVRKNARPYDQGDLKKPYMKEKKVYEGSTSHLQIRVGALVRKESIIS